MKKAALLFLGLVSVLPVLRADDSPKAPYVQVTGEGDVSVQPDQVVVGFGIDTAAPQLAAARDENATRTQNLLNQLKKLGVDSKDIRTNFLQIGPRYDYINGKRKFVEYTAHKSFTVTINDVAGYGKILQAALDAGVEQVSGVQFKTSKEKELEEEARKRAIADARRKADTLAGAAGRKVGPVLLIEENAVGGVAVPMYAMVRQKSMMADAPEDQLAPGEITVRANVNVRFTLQ